MARRLPTEAVITAVVTTLKNSTGVTGLLSSAAAVYNHVPQNAAYPYVEVTAPTGRREDTFGVLGGITMVDVKAVTQALGDKQGAQIRDQCVRALNFQLPSMSEHVALGIAYDSDEALREVVNGIVTRSHIATFRAWTEQTST